MRVRLSPPSRARTARPGPSSLQPSDCISQEPPKMLTQISQPPYVHLEVKFAPFKRLLRHLRAPIPWQDVRLA